MELRPYIDILKRRAILIVIVAALTVTVATASTFVTPSIYQASSTVRVIHDVGVTGLSIGVTYGEILMNTYSRVLTSQPVLQQAADLMGSSLSTGQLRQKVRVEVIPDTELMRIIVQDSDPDFARDLANVLAELLLENDQSLYSGDRKSALQILDGQLSDLKLDIDADRERLAEMLSSGASSTEIDALERQIRFKEDSYDRLLNSYELTRLNESLRANSITIVDPASLPRVPSNVLGMKDVAIAFVVGLSGGVGLALVMENLDTRIHSPQQLEHMTQLPVLGVVPSGLVKLDSARHSNGTGRGQPVEEAYRLLGINLQALRESTPMKTLLISSAMPREGKSTTTVNLAQALAERGQTVFLVESDLRRPTVAKMLSLEGEAGLGTLLAERSALSRELLSQVLQPAKQSSLFVIGSGPTPDNPTALLASPSMDQLLSYLDVQAQTTLLDAPPVLGLADVSVLAPKVDGVILVVAKGVATRESLRDALKQLQAARANVVGFVFLQKSRKDWGYN